MISLIVAASENRVIGHNGGIPWHIPADLKHFRALTIGKPIIMGRLTFESIGHALPKRTNIVLTRDPTYVAEDCIVAADVDTAIAAAGDAPEIMIIGGGKVYEQFLPLASRIYLTEVRGTFEGDAFFPQLDKNEWREIERIDHEPRDADPNAYSFVTLERVT